MWIKLKEFLKTCFTENPSFFGIFVGYFILFVGYSICVSFGGACILVGALISATFIVKAISDSEKKKPSSSRW